ncbi:MAG: hypothetical protein R3D63_07900 [Paracoccaceae bacterium]
MSSIRRLVSEDLRPALRPLATGMPQPQAEAGGAGPQADAGALLLTPALRIVPDVAPNQAPLEADPVDTHGPASEVAAVLASGVRPDEEVYDDIDLEPGDAGLQALFDRPEAPAPLAEVISGAGDDAELLWSAPGATEAGDRGRAGPDRGHDRPPLREVHGHWTAQDVPGMDWAQEETDWVDMAPPAFVTHPRGGLDGAAPEQAANSAMDDPLARAWADRAEADVHATLAGAQAEAEAEPQAEPLAAAAGASAEDGANPTEPKGLFDEDAGAIDEELLRDIVRDIIREELAGTLGERITRNVRKLVRVEINRALTAREFE